MFHASLELLGTSWDVREALYDAPYLDLPYFISSHMTVFQTKPLKHLTAKILFGQISYKQRSEIYNYIHGYDSSVKMNQKHIPRDLDEDTEASR